MQIPVDAIDIVSGARDEDAHKLEMMALSIKAFGLINAVVVAENPLVPGRYTMVAGRRRLKVVKDKLGWEKIEASVRSLSEVDAEMVELSENIDRLDYTAIEEAEATKRYVDLYAAKFPQAKDYLERGAPEKRAQNLKRGTEGPGPGPEPEPAEPAPKTVTPVEAVADKFGKSAVAVHREIRRAEAFTGEEKAVLRDRDVSGRRLDELAKVPPGDKVQVINLLGAGMAYPEAMKEVLGDRYDGDDDEAGDPGLSDEEFLAGCPARARTNQARFDADALFYRSVQKAKLAFARAVGWASAKKKVGEMGIYARRLMLFMEAKHPRDWLVCSNCVRGVKLQGDCPQCKGGGYLIG